jgi:hypothetical protein
VNAASGSAGYGSTPFSTTSTGISLEVVDGRDKHGHDGEGVLSVSSSLSPADGVAVRNTLDASALP